MKYKIEIWQYSRMIDVFETNMAKKMLIWYFTKWHEMYEAGECDFSVYKDGEELDMKQEKRLGFHTYYWSLENEYNKKCRL